MYAIICLYQLSSSGASSFGLSYRSNPECTLAWQEPQGRKPHASHGADAFTALYLRSWIFGGADHATQSSKVLHPQLLLLSQRN